jgi:NADPH:quinone reductase-like Zn-dependent oxidoreductase
MRAGRIHRFGPPEVIAIDEIPRPAPGEGEVLVRTAVAGVGPWDALIREKKSVVDVPLPITLGSDLSGVVDAVGPGITQFHADDEVYGVTNKNFCGAYAEFAVAAVQGIAPKPRSLSFAQAGGAPVVAVTAWQMLFDYARMKAGQTVLIHGAAGNVGAYAVQLARRAQLRIFATAGSADLEYVRKLGADTVIDYRAERFDAVVPPVDAVIDMVGGETQERSFRLLKPDGILVSVVSPLPEESRPGGRRSVFFLVDVTTARLNTLTQLFDSGELQAAAGSVLPLEEARQAHEMLGGAPHARGKIVLTMPHFGQ